MLNSRRRLEEAELDEYGFQTLSIDTAKTITKLYLTENNSTFKDIQV